MSQTVPRMDVATAMLVAIDDRIAGNCVTLLDDAGYRVIRVKHVAPALERLPVAMPQLVLFPTTLHKSELESITERCEAIGAEIVRVAPDADARSLTQLIAKATYDAFVRGR